MINIYFACSENSSGDIEAFTHIFAKDLNIAWKILYEVVKEDYVDEFPYKKRGFIMKEIKKDWSINTCPGITYSGKTQGVKTYIGNRKFDYKYTEP